MLLVGHNLNTPLAHSRAAECSGFLFFPAAAQWDKFKQMQHT